MIQPSPYPQLHAISVLYKAVILSIKKRVQHSFGAMNVAKYLISIALARLKD